MMAARDAGLVRGMTFVHALALVVGGMIGTGIYLRSALMTEQLGSAPLVLLAWLAAGLLSMAGALTYAELGARLPHTGGEYVFMREVYGLLPAFLFGWTRTLVGGASLAAVAVAFATFLSGLVPLGDPWWAAEIQVFGRALSWGFGGRQLVAIGALGCLTAINCAGVVAGARTQTILTAAKVLGLAGLVIGALVLAPQIDFGGLAASSAEPRAFDMSVFGGAMIAALWAYAGWNNLPMTAGEITDPARTLPRAIIGGTLLVAALYLLVNAVYFLVLPLDTIAGANSTTHPEAPALGAIAVQAFLGPAGTSMVLAAFCVSALGTANGMVLSTARVPFAMARDGLLPPVLARLGARSRAPVSSILVMGAWTALLAALGTIDQLATSAVLGYWIFHTLCGIALFILRRRERASTPRHDGFRMPGYPVVPALFVVLGGYLVLNSLRATPIEALWAAGVLALGVPASLVLRQRMPAPASTTISHTEVL